MPSTTPTTPAAAPIELPPGVRGEVIPIIDFGSQYVQLIARRVREAGVYSVLVGPNITLEQLQQLQPKGIILSGGPASVYEEGAPHLRSAPLRARRAGAGHLLRHADRLPVARCAGQQRRLAGVRPRPALRSRQERPPATACPRKPASG